MVALEARKKPVEQVADVVRGDADAGILDIDPPALAVRRRGHPDPPAPRR